jgi:hypothetical protein
MESHHHSTPESDRSPEQSRLHFRKNSFRWRWFAGNIFISGILALIWLVLRSGEKPSRFVYPCQQAAISTATLAFGGPLVAAVIAGRRHLHPWIRKPATIVTIAVGLLVTAACWGYFLRAAEYGEYTGPVLEPPASYRAELFHVATCPQDPTGDRFLGLDNLLAKMGTGGLKFYQSAIVSPVSGPDGIIAADDVVVIKINYQWSERGGTNTDLLRGLIRRIVDHPDLFTGEVIVCENAQFASVQGFDRAENNAQDQSLSPHDVVVALQTEGHNVSHYDWTSVRYTSVGEYSAGDMTDGYVVYDYDSQLHGRISYPKFQSDAGTWISLKHGIWKPSGGSYDRARLKFINVPVLKSHHAVYGATVSVKNYMGVVTRELSTSSHSAIHYGILGAVLGEIQLADLNIIDAIWINANPNTGPGTSYAGATRRDELVASLDPVALDIWAVKNILTPAFVDNGHLPPWPNPSADPDLPSSAFRQYLDNSMYQILAAGHEVTNDLQQIDVVTGDGGAGDFDGDSDVDLTDFDQFSQCFTGSGGGPVSPGCARGDFDQDGDIDCEDWELFRFVWTDPGAPPDLPGCTATGIEDGTSLPPTSLGRAFPNPLNRATRMTYTIGAPGRVKLRVFDVRGRVVRTLVDENLGAGEHGAIWDGTDDQGRAVGSGVFTYLLEAPGFTGSDKIVLLR